MYTDIDGITVVVPCYNVEKYLKRCLESLLTQTYTNIEVIMVDDCSTDGTRAIVRSYEKKYSNFHAIYNEKNGGLGKARNVGIAAAKTEYIGFLDSDDWLPENFLSEMHVALVAERADISICDIYLRYDDSKKDQRVIAYNPRPDKYGLMNTGMAASSSNKLYKTELFKNLKYPEAIVNEDIPVTLALLSRYETAYTNRTHFNYYQRPGSIQNGQVTDKRLEIFKAVRLLKDNLKGEIERDAWGAIVWHQIIAVLMFVFPRAKGLFKRRRLIQKFHDIAEASDVIINDNNFGFREFTKSSRVYRTYGSMLMRFVNQRQYMAASVLMGMYGLASQHKRVATLFIKLFRVVRFMIQHPVSFVRVYGGRIKRAIFRKKVINTNVTIEDIVNVAKKQRNLSGKGRVSVVIPNYNYEHFLIQRIYSILIQTEKIGEIIILDDVSTDNSVALAEKIKKKINQYVTVRTVNNKKNTGTFRQWERGFKEASCEYVWVAEADDYCDAKFLHYALKPFVISTKTVISYVNTGYTNKAGVLIGDVKNDIDYQASGHWDADYINNGLEEAAHYSYLNNTIANVSSVVFRKKPTINYEQLFKDARKYRQAGDWIFYVNYMFYGDIAYTNRVLNYYRVHGENVSSVTKASDHLKEIREIQKTFIGLLKLSDSQQDKMEQRVRLLGRMWNVSDENIEA